MQIKLSKKSQLKKAKKPTGTEIVIQVSEKTPDKENKVFSFAIFTTIEELFTKEHFRVFKTWLKTATSRLKAQRRSKNKQFRDEKKTLPKQEQLTDAEIMEISKNVKKTPLILPKKTMRMK